MERISSCCRSDHFVENISSENYLENPPAGSSSFNCSSSLDDSYSEEIALSSIDKSPETHAEMMMMKKSSSSSETADHRPSKKMILGALSEGGEDPEEWVQEKTRIRKEKNRFLEKRQKRNRDRTHQRTSDLVFRSIQEERDRREQEEEERKSRQEREKRLREEHERRIREEEDLKRVKEEEEERRRRGGKTEERRHNMVQHEQEEGGEEEDDEEDDEEWGGGEAGVVVEETPHQQNQITGMILAQQQRILRGNWCAVGEFSKSVYSQTIFTEAMKKEATTWPGPNYLNYHVEVSWNDRRLLLSWMFDFNVFFGLHSEGLFLSVSTLDRYLEQNLSLPRSRLQLAGLAAMMIAYKFTEKRPRTSQQRISHYLKAAAGQYNARDLLEMEASVLDAINWALNVSTPFCFLERLFPSCVLPDSLPKEDMWFCCLYVAELTICDARILHYLPSIIACSSVYLIRSILGAPSIWVCVHFVYLFFLSLPPSLSLSSFFLFFFFFL